MSLLDRIDTTRSTGPDKRPSTEPSTGPQPGPQPHDGVTVHRRRGALALVGTGALAVAVAYAVRATTGGDPLSYLVSAVLLPVAVLHLGSWWDASTPLLVADQTGVRLRDGRRWIGLRWDDTASVRLTPSRLPRRDGRLLVVGGDGVHHRLPLALVDPTDLRELPDALRVLAGSRTDVAVDERAPQTPAQSADPARAADPDSPSDPAGAAGAGAATSGLSTDGERISAGQGGSAARADVVHRSPDDGSRLPHGRVEVRALRDAAPGRVEMVLEHTGLQPGTPPVVAVEAGPAVEPDPDSAGPPQRAVVGSQLAGARQRLRLSIDDVADRTRIRPHVIDAIEVDDFSSCGGDVYARGHLRALARVLGVDGDPLVAQFDTRYASAPVTARRVFEAELAGPSRSLRPTSGGPRWSVLVFVVLVLVLVWAVARLLVPPAPDGSPDQGEGGSGRSAPGFSQTGAPADAPPDGDTAASRFADMGERPARTPPEG